MKLVSVLALAACAVISPSAVHALDCAKASLEAEKFICASPEAKKADDAMTAAYFALLRRTTDPDFHQALIRSQRRWIEARSRGVPRIDGEEDEEPDDRKVLLKITKDRLNFLKGNEPICTMEQQRKIASKESGGPFAGYEGPCGFMPPRYGHWEYVCWIATHRQHKDRICSVGEEWTSGHTTERRLVSVVTNGELKPVASCYTGYAGSKCPDPESLANVEAAAHWNTNPQISFGDLGPPRASRLWKYDPDGPAGYDEPWMQDCLFAPSYPPPDLSRPDPSPSGKTP
ncbi:lysozyme inhibitor LprI family protein [Bradyrhizobium barranii subsp. apii]|uniref:Lysozyme inhibitor LprI family protein n=1 Tax=Bradyrhizobium barranii subsp. apii TaxID=2819348 RepID=A0A8T5V9P9_9BRAD|nr:lysozyme inhibitor LprI family protein [Bradyrhizobium barranii]UPT86011.1 lysozyme inhibitor LprI family protein [Bradyrhizobium barranii subsp. apii]